MKVLKNICLGYSILFYFGCSSLQKKHIAPKIELDHIIFFSKNAQEVLSQMDKSGFTHAKALYTRHHGQGTDGYYNLFYNTVFEFLFLVSEEEARSNLKSFRSNYIKRWDEKDDGVCRFAFGLKMNPYEPNNVPFSSEKYIPNHKNEDSYYIMSSDNTNLSSPAIFISKPETYHQPIEAISDLVRIKDENIRRDAEKYFVHPNRATKVKYIELTIPQDSPNSEILKKINLFKVIKGKECKLKVVFQKDTNSKVVFGDRDDFIIQY